MLADREFVVGELHGDRPHDRVVAVHEGVRDEFTRDDFRNAVDLHANQADDHLVFDVASAKLLEEGLCALEQWVASNAVQTEHAMLEELQLGLDSGHVSLIDALRPNSMMAPRFKSTSSPRTSATPSALRMSVLLRLARVADDPPARSARRRNRSNSSGSRSSSWPAARGSTRSRLRRARCGRRASRARGTETRRPAVAPSAGVGRSARVPRPSAQFDADSKHVTWSIGMTSARTTTCGTVLFAIIAGNVLASTESREPRVRGRDRAIVLDADQRSPPSPLARQITASTMSSALSVRRSD